MDAAPLQTPAELVQAIASSGGVPLRLQNPDTRRVYTLLEEVSEPMETTLDSEYINQKLDEAIAAVEAGQVVPWDAERIKQEGRRLLAERGIQVSD